MAQTKERVDVYQRVTDRIIQAIEAGADTWVMPWHVQAAGYPVNAATKKPYRGVNVLTLWVEAQAKGYTDCEWATYNQWQELGKQIAGGEKATWGVFWKQLDRDGEGDTDTEDGESKRRVVISSFALFNACQTEGYVPGEVPERPQHERIEAAEEFFSSLPMGLKHGGSKAYYSPSTDHVYMPPFEAFMDPLAYYATLAHEATHWTGHESRLDRDLSGRFGNEVYAAEELIAELGAAFVCATLGLAPEPRDEHASYIQSWLKILKGDNRAIFAAASHAQRAADFMHGFQLEPGPNPSHAPPEPLG